VGSDAFIGQGKPIGCHAVPKVGGSLRAARIRQDCRSQLVSASPDRIQGVDPLCRSFIGRANYNSNRYSDNNVESLSRKVGGANLFQHLLIAPRNLIGWYRAVKVLWSANFPSSPGLTRDLLIAPRYRRAYEFKSSAYGFNKFTYGFKSFTYGFNSFTYGLKSFTYGFINKTYGFEGFTYVFKAFTYGFKLFTYVFTKFTYGFVIFTYGFMTKPEAFLTNIHKSALNARAKLTNVCKNTLFMQDIRIIPEISAYLYKYINFYSLYTH
jgi:hypothetical protein